MQEPAQNRLIDDSFTEALNADPRIRSLCTVGYAPFLRAGAVDWGIIFFAALLSNELPNGILYFCSCLVIGGRQHAFFALSHEAAHNRISCQRKWNDLFANWLFAYPILFETDGYRKNHLQHHASLNSEADPDWMRKIHLAQWQFPKKLSYVARTFPNFLIWNGPREWVLIMLQLARVLPVKQLTQRSAQLHVMERVAYYAIWAAPIQYFGLWKPFLYYWVVPLFLVFPTLQRIRSVAEHFGLKYTNVLEQTRNVKAAWYERFFLAPHNLHLHLDHHLIAAVPFYNLPVLHRLLLENQEFRNGAHENSSYLVPSPYPVTKDLFDSQKASNNEAATLSRAA